MVHFGSSGDWDGFELGITEEEHQDFNELILKQKHYNGWFTEDMVRKSLFNLGSSLSEKDLKTWTANYDFAETPNTSVVFSPGS